MSNPARELHTILLAWFEMLPADRSVPILSMVRIRDDDVADDMIRVYRLLGDIDQIIRRLELRGAPVDVFRRQLRGWARVPLAVDSTWNTTNGTRDAFIPPAILDQIETFALYLDGKVLTFSAEMQESLAGLVGSAHDVLTEDDSLSPQLREYLHYLLQEISNALADEKVGRSFDFADATRRLWVAFEAAAGSADTAERRQKWKDLAQAIIVGVTSTGIVEAGAAAITLALGQ